MRSTGRRLAEHLPIMAGRLRGAGYPAAFEEREITAAVDLCDRWGRLNPAAVGFSRVPLVRSNLRWHWPRKKRWNFWNWIGPRFVLSATIADIDYAAFCQVTFIDFERKRTVGRTEVARPGCSELPEYVGRTVSFRGRSTRYTNVHGADGMQVDLSTTARSGEPIIAAFFVHTPPAQESLNVVVPWTANRFQANSKHNTLPCTGEVRVGDTRYAMWPEECHGVQDFGRGVWPYRSFWNWGVATGVDDGIRIGVNVGGKWTTGTGVTENGLLIDGRLHKIMEDLHWDYDSRDWMRPWRVRAEHSGMVDLTLEPRVAHRVRTSLGLLSTAGVCCFGRWHGMIRFDGRERRIQGLVGWAEEFAHRW